MKHLIRLTLFTLAAIGLSGCGSNFAKATFGLHQNLTPKEQCLAWRRQMMYNTNLSTGNIEAKYTTRTQHLKLTELYRAHNCNKLLRLKAVSTVTKPKPLSRVISKSSVKHVSATKTNVRKVKASTKINQTKQAKTTTNKAKPAKVAATQPTSKAKS